MDVRNSSAVRQAVYSIISRKNTQPFIPHEFTQQVKNDRNSNSKSNSLSLVLGMKLFSPPPLFFFHTHRTHMYTCTQGMMERVGMYIIHQNFCDGEDLARGRPGEVIIDCCRVLGSKVQPPSFSFSSFYSPPLPPPLLPPTPSSPSHIQQLPCRT